MGARTSSSCRIWFRGAVRPSRAPTRKPLALAQLATGPVGRTANRTKPGTHETHADGSEERDTEDGPPAHGSPLTVVKERHPRMSLSKTKIRRPSSATARAPPRPPGPVRDREGHLPVRAVGTVTTVRLEDRAHDGRPNKEAEKQRSKHAPPRPRRRAASCSSSRRG